MATSAEERLLRIVEIQATTIDVLTSLLSDERRNTMANITQLVEQVKKETEVEAAAVALIKGLADQIDIGQDRTRAGSTRIISDLKIERRKGRRGDRGEHARRYRRRLQSPSLLRGRRPRRHADARSFAFSHAGAFSRARSERLTTPTPTQRLRAWPNRACGRWAGIAFQQRVLWTSSLPRTGSRSSLSTEMEACWSPMVQLS